MRRLRRSGNGAVVSRSPSSVARVQSPELVSHVAGLSFLLVLALLEGNTPVLESGEEDPRRGMSTAKFHYSHYYYYYYQHITIYNYHFKVARASVKNSQSCFKLLRQQVVQLKPKHLYKSLQKSTD